MTIVTHIYIEESLLIILVEKDLKMREPISESSKEEIVRLWLGGLQRDIIAAALNLGAGTVSKVISELKSQIGTPTVDALRTLAKELKNQNITALQCAEAYRFLNQLKDANGSLEEIAPFIVEIQKRCNSSGMSANKIFDICKQISELGPSISIEKLPESISEEIKTKQGLEKDVATIRKTNEALKKEFSSLFDRSRITNYELKKHKETQKTLENYGISLDDLENVVSMIDNLKDYNFEIKGIVRELGEIRNCKKILVNLRPQVSSSQISLARANDEYRAIEHKLASCAQEMAVYNQLEQYGIFLSDLIFLRNKVVEIVHANIDSNINYQILTPSNAFKKFLKDVETQYDTKVGFERKLQETEASMKRTQQENQSLMQEYSKRRDVYDRVEELIDMGVKPSDILQINDILKASGIKLQRIGEDLKLYGSLTNTLDEQKMHLAKLQSECIVQQATVNKLKTEQEEISTKNRSLFYQHDLIKKEFKEDINQELHSFAKGIQKKKIENEIEYKQIRNRLEAMKAEEREKLSLFKKIDAPLEFLPVLQAARGLTVNNDSLGNAVSKAIQILISRLDQEYHATTIIALKQAMNGLKSELVLF